MLNNSLCKHVTVVEVAAGSNAMVSTTQLQLPKDKSKRKVSKGCKCAEKQERVILQALGAYASRALELHEKSAHKKKDAWLRDQTWNHQKALLKANKELKKLR